MWKNHTLQPFKSSGKFIDKFYQNRKQKKNIFFLPAEITVLTEQCSPKDLLMIEVKVVYRITNFYNIFDRKLNENNFNHRKLSTRNQFSFLSHFKTVFFTNKVLFSILRSIYHKNGKKEKQNYIKIVEKICFSFISFNHKKKSTFFLQNKINFA